MICPTCRRSQRTSSSVGESTGSRPPTTSPSSSRRAVAARARHRRPREEPHRRRRVGNRLRRRPQLLLLAADGRGDPRLGRAVRDRPGRASATTRSATSRPCPRCRRRIASRSSSSQAEIGYRSDVVLGEQRLHRAHARDLPRLERRGDRGRPPRAAGRLGRDDEDGREPRPPRALARASASSRVSR